MLIARYFGLLALLTAVVFGLVVATWQGADRPASSESRTPSSELPSARAVSAISSVGPAIASGPPAARCGDLTGDGVANVFDTILILQMVVGLAEPDFIQQVVADLDRDGLVRIPDVVLALQHTVGRIVLTQCGLPITIDIAAPVNLDAFSASPITVSGVTDGPVAAVTVNEVTATLGEGTFTATGVPLKEGNNTITAVAAGVAGGVATASIQVSLDTAPPRVTIDSPRDGAVTDAPAITVAGLINDIVVGTVNGGQAQVTVNEIPAQVSNRSYLAADVPLSPGPNTITATGTDRAGNTAATSITVTFQPVMAVPRIRLVSGNNQTGDIGGELPGPLVVALTDGEGQPVAGETVVFEVTENNGSLRDSPTGRRLAVTTDAQGQAQAFWTLGARAGAGNNVVEATAFGFAGRAVFTAIARPGAPAKINVDSGNNQTGVVGEPLPGPLVAVVTDAGHNRLAGVPVTFTVTEGDGNFGGQPSVTLNTDSDGRALAALTLGPGEGSDNNVAQATFGGNPGLPATFVASGLVPGDPAQTSISGVVLDNSDNPIAGVTMGIHGTDPSALLRAGIAVATDEEGQFVIQPAPVGHVLLVADGSTAQRPGLWPTLEYELVTVAGRDNTIGMPVYLLPLEEEGLFVDEDTGGTLSLPQFPGFALTVLPGSATFPDGGPSGVVSVTVVNQEKIPMTPNFGQQPEFVVTIQPPGVHFDPPAPITVPNLQGLSPGEVTEMFSFDHDMGRFVSIGTGTVSEDGMVIASDPGVGIIKGGWHGASPPNDTGEAENTDVQVSSVGPIFFPPPPTSSVIAGSAGDSPALIAGPGSLVIPLKGGRTLTAVGQPQPGAYHWTFNNPAIADLLCPCDPVDFDADFVNVEGKALGTATITVNYTAESGATDSDTVQVHVMEVDLDIVGVDDANDADGEDEETRGGFVSLNDDDDNSNNIQDKNDAGGIPGENDLRQIRLRVEPTDIPGQIILDAPSGAGRIRVWENASRTTQVALPKTYNNISQVPASLFVEGIQASAAGKDVELTLTFRHTVPGGSATSIVDKVKFTVVQIIFEVNTPSDTLAPPGENSFVGARPGAAANTGDQIELRGRVVGRPELDSAINWTAAAVGGHTGAPVPANAVGNTFQFRAVSAQSIAQRVPNPNTPKEPLEYQVIATVTIDGVVIEDRVPRLLPGETAATRLPFSPIRQDERDIMRQEYRDFGTNFQPDRSEISVPTNPLFNTGNYTMIAENPAGTMQDMLNATQNNVNDLLNNDVQVVPVGDCVGMLDPSGSCVGAPALQNTVVVSPGPGFTTAGHVVNIGPLGDTDPQGDDGCTGAIQDNICRGSVTAGPNLISETPANNSGVVIDLTGAVTSAYRNPQRNRDVGSVVVNSLHVQGRAMDVDPDIVIASFRGKTRQEAFCYVERAAEMFDPDIDAFNEIPPATDLPCTDPTGSTVHIEFENPPP